VKELNTYAISLRSVRVPNPKQPTTINTLSNPNPLSYPSINKRCSSHRPAGILLVSVMSYKHFWYIQPHHSIIPSLLLSVPFRVFTPYISNLIPIMQSFNAANSEEEMRLFLVDEVELLLLVVVGELGLAASSFALAGGSSGDRGGGSGASGGASGSTSSASSSSGGCAGVSTGNGCSGSSVGTSSRASVDTSSRASVSTGNRSGGLLGSRCDVCCGLLGGGCGVCCGLSGLSGLRGGGYEVLVCEREMWVKIDIPTGAAAGAAATPEATGAAATAPEATAPAGAATPAGAAAAKDVSKPKTILDLKKTYQEQRQQHQPSE
jgi:hypothetical protein